MRDVVGGPRPDPGQRDKGASHVSRSAPRSSATAPRARDAARPTSAHRGAFGIGRSSGSTAASVTASGNRCVRPGMSVVDGPPVLGDDPARDRAGPDDADLLPDHGADRGLVTVDLPRTRKPGVARTSGPRTGSPANWSSTASGSQSASTRRRARSTAAVVSRRSCSTKRAVYERRLSGNRGVGQRQPDGARAVWQVEGAGVPARSRDLYPRHQVVGQEVEQPGARERGADGEPHRDGARAGHPAAPAAQGGRAGGVDLAHGVVELPDAGEAGRERDVGEPEVGGLDEDPRGLRAARPGQRQRAGAELSR